MSTLTQLADAAAELTTALEDAEGELTPDLEAALDAFRFSERAKVDGYAAVMARFAHRRDAGAASAVRDAERGRVAGAEYDRLGARLGRYMESVGVDALDGAYARVTRDADGRVHVAFDRLPDAEAAAGRPAGDAGGGDGDDAVGGALASCALATPEEVDAYVALARAVEARRDAARVPRTRLAALQQAVKVEEEAAEAVVARLKAHALTLLVVRQARADDGAVRGISRQAHGAAPVVLDVAVDQLPARFVEAPAPPPAVVRLADLAAAIKADDPEARAVAHLGEQRQIARWRG